MKFRSETRDVLAMCRRVLRNTQCAARDTKKKAFSLVEVVAALAILAIVSSSVLVVINRCVASAADSALRMQAFELARENMEKLLASNSVKESAEYGESDRYPGIAWQTVVETFYEPITARMWIRGVCSAQYNDTEGQEQTIELIHWLTDLTREQLFQIMKQDEEETEQLADQLIETLEEAAQYAGVDVETIEQWVENGMLTTDDGSFVKSNLDLYVLNDGNPSAEDKKLQVSSEAELAAQPGKSGPGRTADQEGWQDEIEPKTGLTYEELDKMDFSEIWELLKNRQR